MPVCIFILFQTFQSVNYFIPARRRAGRSDEKTSRVLLTGRRMAHGFAMTG